MKHILLFISLLLLRISVLQAASPVPPQQQSSGPGSSEYRHASLTKSVYGKGAEQFWIFSPAEPVPDSAPVIVFNHGWGGTDPGSYGAWLKHIVRRGNIVIFPVYQESKWRYPTHRITSNAIAAVKKAIRLLQEENKIKPELNNFAIVGHSAGAMITANMAALTEAGGLPVPKAIMIVQPGKSWTKLERTAIPLENPGKISPKALLLAVVGDRDRIVFDRDAKKIFRETSQIPPENKNFIIMRSDSHGSPELSANHFAPAAYDKELSTEGKSGKKPLILERLRRRNNRPDTENKTGDLNRRQAPNALDYYGFWKLFDGLCDTAFYGKNRRYALGNTPEQRFMGKWSDGTPVKKLIVNDNP